MQGGAAVHIFNDGSGTVVGLLAATGADLTISDKLKIPLALRIEPVFGNATPFAVSIVTGLKYVIR